MTENVDKKPIELIDELYHSGMLKELVKKGIVSSNILIWRNVIHAYEFRYEATKSVMQSMEEVATNFNISIESVRQIRRKLT